MMSSTRRRFAISSALALPRQIMPSNQLCVMRTCRPVSRLSTTVICGKSSMFWKVRAMPIAATLSGRAPMIDEPFQRMSPSCGRYTWLMVLKIEVLPAPFGPMIENSSPGFTWKATSLMAVTPPNRSVMSSTSRMGSVIVLSPQLRTTSAYGACSA